MASLHSVARAIQELAPLASKPAQFEKQKALDHALDVMPLAEFYDKAAESEREHPEWGLEEHVAQAFLVWFKGWFTWVNNAHCVHCSSKNTHQIGTAAPTTEERRYQARVVEVYQCHDCSQTTRFPRYGDAEILLETRSGRCGEWADAATLCLRSLGLDVRWVWNSEDHVWTEVWSATQQRWIHVDSCEGAWDNPTIYTDGWGKKMAYVLAFSVTGATDVTRRYVRREEMQLPRTRFGSEEALYGALASITQESRVSLDTLEQVELYERDQAEEIELRSYTTTKTTGMLPRQSGDADWVKERGEAGTD